MSRYLLLAILNFPLILAAVVGSFTRYKLGKSSPKQTILQILFWVIIFIGIATSKIIYEWLFTNNLTQTEPLSLFDVVQITAIISLLFAMNKLRIKQEQLENRLEMLHRELSIKLSKKD